MQNTTTQNKKAKSHLPHKHTTFSKREPALAQRTPNRYRNGMRSPLPLRASRMRYLGLYFSFQILLRKVIH